MAVLTALYILMEPLGHIKNAQHIRTTHIKNVAKVRLLVQGINTTVRLFIRVVIFGRIKYVGSKI